MTVLQPDLLNLTLRGPFARNEDTIAEGPFVVEHGGLSSIGAHLERNGNEYTLFDGDRMLVLDETYTIQVEPDGKIIRATSAQYHSNILIRPLTGEDYVLLGPDAEEEPLAELMFTAYDQVRRNGILGDETPARVNRALVAAGRPIEEGEFGITVDENGVVLELVKVTENGVFIREGAAWTALDPDTAESDEDTVYGREWFDVRPDAVIVYDEQADADTLSKDDFTSYILN